MQMNALFFFFIAFFNEYAALDLDNFSCPLLTPFCGMDFYSEDHRSCADKYQTYEDGMNLF
jgi:hypothetical protein